MPDCSVAPSPIHGTGVFALRDFREGDVVLTLDDSRVVDDAHPLRAELGEHPYHCDYLEGGTVVLMPSPERHINSSCEPNTFVQTVGGARQVIALRDVSIGTEITYDYLINCHGGEVWACTCGSASCRGTMVSSFFDLPLADQRRLRPLLDSWFMREHRARVARLDEAVAPDRSVTR